MRTLILTLVILSILSPGATATAQEIITVLDIQHTVTFGQTVTFELTVHAEHGLSAVELIFQENGVPDSLVIPATFDHDDAGVVAHVTAAIDLTRYTLTPFARGFYSWHITDRDGNELDVDMVPFNYDDNRFAWDVRSQGNINLHTYERTTAQAQAALDQALAAQARIEDVLQVPTPAVIDIFVYNSAEVLRAGLALHGRDSIDGYADPRHNVILVSAGLTYPELDLRRQLPHELTHIYIGNFTGEAFVPAWLVEGSALLFEAEPDPELAAIFDQAAQNGALHPLETLCPAFPLDRARFALAYAQSYEVVRYVENRYGPDGIRALLDAYAQGASCQGGVAQALSTSLETLERDWLLSLDAEEARPSEPSLLPWATLLVIFIIWPAVMLTLWRGQRDGARKRP